MIPLSVPNLAGKELEYITECIKTNWVSSVGSFVERFEQSVAEFTGAKYAVSTMNGSAALHLSLLMAGVKQGDYVIVPNVTFIASANTVTYLKASPLLVDVDSQTWQIDLELLEKFLIEKSELRGGECRLRENDRRIRALMPVHVLGNMCDMNRLMAIAKKFHLTVIEDASESLGSYFDGQHSGTFGEFGCLSFNGNKIITTGGGGMILTNNQELAREAKHLTTQAKSDPFEYFHDEIGYNYRLVNLLAAMGVAQMELLSHFLATKEKIFHRYDEAFSDIPGIAAQVVTGKVKSNYWLQTFSFDRSSALMKHLGSAGIQVRPLWVPMNRLPMFKDGLYVTQNDVSGAIYGRCVSLPCSTNLTDAEQEKVISEITQFYNGSK